MAIPGEIQEVRLQLVGEQVLSEKDEVVAEANIAAVFEACRCELPLTVMLKFKLVGKAAGQLRHAFGGVAITAGTCEKHMGTSDNLTAKFYKALVEGFLNQASQLAEAVVLKTFFGQQASEGFGKGRL